MKINIKKSGALLCISLFSVSVWGQQNIITLSAPETGNQIHAACKQVHLAPGYSFHSSPGQTMHAYIDPYLVCDVTYVNGFSSGGTGIAPVPLNTGLEVGTTEGIFNVSLGGSTYTIPLFMPPGTGKMQPNLSLAYSSFGRDGMFGIGWSLSGLSSITRTSQTIYHDGKVTPVSINNDDRFLLDGARLIVTGSGTYGAAGTTYGTAEETFMKITSLGDDGGNPNHFTVETKDGSILEYGNTTDSKIEFAYTTKALTWLLNKVTDKNGNYMTITYLEDNANGSFRPDHIDYTGNANTGLTPYNQIKFVYGTRGDKQVSYVTGAQLNQDVLVVGLEIYALGNKIHEYNFNYSYDMSSHLSEVIEKGLNGEQYNSTKFSWDSNYDIKPVENPLPYFDNKGGDYLSADINNDGFSEVIKFQGNTWILYQNEFLTVGNVSFSFNPPYTNNNGEIFPSRIFQPDAPLGSYPRIIRHNTSAYDLNGDGLDDLMTYLPPTDGIDVFSVGWPGGIAPAEFQFFLSNGSGLIRGDSNPINTNTEDANLGYALGDFDGDGTTDLFTYNPFGAIWRIYSFKTGTPFQIASGANSYYWESTENYSISNNPDFIPPIAAFPQLPDFYAFDMNGDGKDEIALVGDGTRLNFTVNSGYKSFFVNELTPTGSLHEIFSDFYPFQTHQDPISVGHENAVYPGDFNGDGKADLLVWEPGAGWKTSYSTGVSYTHFPATLPLSAYIPPSIPPYSTGLENRHQFFVCDFNADGKADILEKITDGVNGTDMHTMYSKGGNNNFIEDYTHLTNIYTPSLYAFAVTNCIGDYNGDGHPDLLYRDGCADRASAFFSFLPNKNINKVHQITNGLNLITNIEYSSLPLLARQNSYTKENTATYPLNDFQGGLIVVSKLKTDNGIGSTNETNYSYKGAKIHIAGEGFLGFTGISKIDVATNHKEENTYETPSVSNFLGPTYIKQKHCS